LKQGFTGLCGLLDRQLRAKWEQHIMENIPITNSELLNVLGRLPTFAVTVSKIKSLSDQIIIMEQDLPKDKEGIKAFDCKVEELKQAWLKIGSDEVPEGVMLFLYGAVSEGAVLNLLTDEVKQWLDLHKLNEFFVINLKS